MVGKKWISPPLRKNHLDPFWATFHSDDVIVCDLPGQIARIGSFWVEKCNSNKNDPIFSRLWDFEIFKNFDIFFLVSFFESTHSEQKKTKQFFSPLRGQANLALFGKFRKKYRFFYSKISIILWFFVSIGWKSELKNAK